MKNDTTNKSELQRVYIYKLHPTDSIITRNERFLNNDDSSLGGTHWTCFIVRDQKSYYSDSLGGVPDKFLLNQLAKPIIYHN